MDCYLNPPCPFARFDLITFKLIARAAALGARGQPSPYALSQQGTESRPAVETAPARATYIGARHVGPVAGPSLRGRFLTPLYLVTRGDGGYNTYT